MVEASPRRRSAAKPPVRKAVKTSVILDADLHVRLAAAAAIRGMDRSALAAEFIADGLRGIVVFDRRKPTAHGGPDSDVGSAA